MARKVFGKTSPHACNASPRPSAPRRGGGFESTPNMPLNPVYALPLGVDVENLLGPPSPDTGEMALEIVDQLVRSAAVESSWSDLGGGNLDPAGLNRGRNG